MSRKVKCIECQNSMNWALPVRVTDKNIEYAKHCLFWARKTIVCDRTQKTKHIEREQYCKYFKKKVIEDSWHQKEIERLERMINEYESQNCKEVGGMNV